jgi:hypothetical protein
MSHPALSEGEVNRFKFEIHPISFKALKMNILSIKSFIWVYTNIHK